jgi:hypothetical protein
LGLFLALKMTLLIFLYASFQESELVTYTIKQGHDIVLFGFKY